VKIQEYSKEQKMRESDPDHEEPTSSTIEVVQGPKERDIITANNTHPRNRSEPDKPLLLVLLNIKKPFSTGYGLHYVYENTFTCFLLKG
jgi:hypothetical protein